MRRTMPPMFRALRHRNYRLWATADLISVTGSWMQVIGLNWVVLERTGSATSVGFSVLLSTLPAVLLGPWAGALADRLPVRRIVLVCQTLHAVLAGALAVAIWLDLPMAAVYALTVTAGLISVFDGPAFGRLSSQIVPHDGLANAVALGSVVSSVGRILGMSTAALLIALVGAPMLFVLNGLSFGAVIAAVLCIRREELHPLAASTACRAGVRDGLRYIVSSGRLLLLVALGFVLSCLGRNYQVTMAAMSTDAAMYGVLSSVFAIGTVLGGLFAAARPRLSVRLLLMAAGLASVLQAAGGLLPGPVAFAVVLVPIAAAAVLIDTTMSTRLQLDSEEGMRGRMLAISGSTGAAAGALGAPLLGWLCERIGADTTLVLAGTTTLLVTLSAATLFAASPQRRTALAHRVLRRHRSAPHPAGHPHQPKPLTRPRRRARVRAATRTTV
ncbi:transmembrane secretion effector [Lentzea atacamensis]|uniref:Transmembrane secretion effector n=1 Tax=Lentzea atacamensis TaxID=531938 RepID=A0A316HW69_9PSEU|nr:MFS transporter [Lentzea atacamensis]PWK84894.1 transmembrane secretion effector [Lentzea atacamensis]